MASKIIITDDDQGDASGDSANNMIILILAILATVVFVGFFFWRGRIPFWNGTTEVPVTSDPFNVNNWIEWWNMDWGFGNTNSSTPTARPQPFDSAGW